MNTYCYTSALHQERKHFFFPATKWLPGIILMLITNIMNAHAQPFAISSLLHNSFYAGMSNSLNVVVSGRPCREIFLTADSGAIEQQTPDYPCQFVLTPYNPGRIQVTVHAIRKKDTVTIGTATFISKNPPEPAVFIDRVKDGYLKKNRLIPQIGPTAEVRGLECSPRYVIQTFTVVLLRENKIIFSQTISGIYFSEEMKDAFRNAQLSDILLIKDVTCKGVDGKIRQLLPGVFMIKD